MEEWPALTTEDHRPAVRLPSIAALGRSVRFTGTFLKMVRYEAGDGGRLAPLVVGDQLPVPVSGEPETDRYSAVESPATMSPVLGSGQTGVAIKIAYWTIGLVLGGLGGHPRPTSLAGTCATGAGRSTTSSFCLRPPAGIYGAPRLSRCLIYPCVPRQLTMTHTAGG